MKSVLVIVTPLVLLVILGGLIYMHQTGMIEEMFGQPGTAQKLPDIDSSTPGGLPQARDIARANLETQRREELKRLRSESSETRRKKRLLKSMDGWLKRTD